VTSSTCPSKNITIFTKPRPRSDRRWGFSLFATAQSADHATCIPGNHRDADVIRGGKIAVKLRERQHCRRLTVHISADQDGRQQTKKIEENTGHPVDVLTAASDVFGRSKSDESMLRSRP
jgi:hypothetical protein